MVDGFTRAASIKGLAPAKPTEWSGFKYFYVEWVVPVSPSSMSFSSCDPSVASMTATTTPPPPLTASHVATNSFKQPSERQRRKRSAINARHDETKYNKYTTARFI